MAHFYFENTPHGKRKDGSKLDTGKHYDYISREADYANMKNRQEDLKLTSFGNLPEWAENPRDFWQKAEEIMKDVYTQILTISTIAAVVTAAIALLLMNFSKSGRTVDESRAWLKRIIITWAILNGLGFIMAYITPFFTGGKWNG